jgi:hypothetical protein
MANASPWRAAWPTLGSFDPVALRQEGADRLGPGRMLGMHIDERGGAAGRRYHVTGLQARLEARRHQLGLHVHHARDGLMPVVGAENEQHLLALVAQPVDRLDHPCCVRIGLGQHSEMLRRAQGNDMLRGIGLAHP